MALTDTIKEHLKDGGYKSRKFWLVVWTQAQIVGVACLAAWKCPALVPMLPTIAGTLIGAAALFITGNVAAKQVLGKQFDVIVTSPEKAPKAKPQEVPADQAG
jgi:hypothetical protein